jgi:uncharacterized protein YfaA (DUF2138 family)
MDGASGPQSRTKTGWRWTVAFAWLEEGRPLPRDRERLFLGLRLQDHEAAEQLLRLDVRAVGHDHALALPARSKRLDLRRLVELLAADDVVAVPPEPVEVPFDIGLLLLAATARSRRWRLRDRRS